MKSFYIWMLAAFIACAGNAESKEQINDVKEAYACIPCGSSCDDSTYTSTGMCVHCNMELVKKSGIVHKNIQPEAMCALNEKETVFLDVRTPEEFSGRAEQKFGAIKNAINIPVQELQQRMKELESYKNKKMIVYCSHSRRSPRASYLLTQHGFTNVTNMLGGMSVWNERVKEKPCNQKLLVVQ